ncbi:T9SS type A sorting domain-containing protein [bacterium]|nr:T9SS type A sorting domain-containing protein [bacterium]MBU1881107.1 T9SS type A sorting domain-containing protein [bacterium]
MRRVYLTLLLILVPTLLLAATHSLDNPAVRQAQNYALTTGAEEIDAPTAFPPYNLYYPDNADVIGDTMTVGTTWYDIQHNGTTGRYITKSDDGYVHIAWMNGTNNGATDRHIYYNFISNEGIQGFPYAGAPVESSIRAGYTTIDADHGGIAFPCFHQQTGTNPNFTTAVGADFFPHQGAFLVSEPARVMIGGQEQEVIWPRIMFDNSQTAHILSTENPLSGVAGDPQRHFWTPGTYDPPSYMMTYPPDPDTWELVAWTMTIAGDVATSPVSDRVAFAWTYPLDENFPTLPGDYSQYDNDIYLMIDDDGQDLHFENFFNLTQYHDVNEQWLPDTVLANMDTLRAYTDLNVFIDNQDWTHVVYTARSYFALEGTSYWHASIIWHWSEQFPGEFQMVHDAFDDWDWNYVSCGAWNVKAQRPSIGQDPETDYLYCMYQVYDVDTTALSALGWPSGEIYVSMSEDGGQNWSVGINVTSTVTPNSAPAGQCWSELTPSMAQVVDGTCHIAYIVDRDAGAVVQTEGGWTYNQAKYHAVPVDEIPSTPLVPQWPEPGSYPFHVEHAPPVGIPGAGRFEVASTFDLSQNYPNPFNPSTTIQFSLEQVSEVSMKVFNLLGEEVATVASGTYGTGQHTVNFDASNLSSGMYIYKLEAGGRSLAKKMMLIK